MYYSLKKYTAYLFFLSTICFFWSCETDNSSQVSVSIKLNPSRRAPLAGLASISAAQPCKVKVRVIGKNGSASDAIHEYPQLSEKHQVAVLGLYPNYNNQVEFTFTNQDHQVIEKDTVSVQTEVYDLMSMTINEKKEGIEPGFLCISDSHHKSGVVFFDNFGEVRAVYNYNAGVFVRLTTGDYISYTYGTRQITLVDALGYVANRIKIPKPYVNIHHDIYELADNKCLVLVSKLGSKIQTSKGERESVEDFILEIDLTTGDITNEWDLRQILDVDRAIFHSQRNLIDWLHLNSIVYDPNDQSLIGSGRNQGVIKVDYATKQLKWIMTPHVGFGKIGPNNDIDWNPKDYLLTATDKSGVVYSDSIQKGLAYPSETMDPFHWCFGQHNAKIIPSEDGLLHFLVFNNSASFIFDDTTTRLQDLSNDLTNDQTGAPYSLMTEYVVDEKAKTIYEQVSYKQDKYSAACSGVYIGEQTGNVMMFGTGDCEKEGKFTEFKRSGEMLMDADVKGIGLLYRAERYSSLYPTKKD